MTQIQREWDSSCPHVWLTWEAKGKTWTIEDLPPEDDEKALQLLADILVADEPLFRHIDMKQDPEAYAYLVEGWRHLVKLRLTLACYTVENGEKVLVGINCCQISQKGVKEEGSATGRKWENLNGAMAIIKNKVDEFEVLGLDRVLYGLGLVVRPEYRGAKIGKRIIEAREPLCKSLGLKAAVTLYTSPAAQKLADMCGYTTIAEASWIEFADAGLDFPRVNNVVKTMYKRYD